MSGIFQNSDERIQTGERYAIDHTNGDYYRVTKWKDHEGARITPINKEQVELAEIPQSWRERLDLGDT